MKKTLIVLLAALAALAIVLLKNRSDNKAMQKDAPVLDSTRKAEVKSVLVIHKSDTTNLQLKDGKWVVTRDSWPADTAKVNKTLHYLFGLQAKERVSQNAARYSEYGLDSNEAKHMALRDGSGKSIAEVVIGKPSGVDFSSTYWRWESKPDVYRTPGNFSWEIASKEDDWKDRKLVTAKSTDVKFIETTWKDTLGMAYHYKLEATSDTTWKMLEPVDSIWVKKSLLQDMAARFSELTIDEFVAAKDTNVSKLKLDSPMVALKVTLKNGQTMEIKGSQSLQGYIYVKHPSRTELVKLSGWRMDAFKKKPFELFEAPPAPKPDSAHAGNPNTSPAGSASAVPTGHPGLPSAVKPADVKAPVKK